MGKFQELHGKHCRTKLIKIRFLTDFFGNEKHLGAEITAKHKRTRRGVEETHKYKHVLYAMQMIDTPSFRRQWYLRKASCYIRDVGEAFTTKSLRKQHLLQSRLGSIVRQLSSHPEEKTPLKIEFESQTSGGHGKHGERWIFA